MLPLPNGRINLRVAMPDAVSPDLLKSKTSQLEVPSMRLSAMKRLIPILVVLVAAIAVGLYFYPRLTRKPAPSNQLTLSGNIEAHESLVSFKVPGRIIDLPVEEGQQVEQGAELARLEDADYRQRVRVDQANVNVRESNLALTMAGTRDQEIKASEQSMLDAHADMEQKQIDCDRAQKLFAKDEVSAQERDLAATALKRAQAVFRSAQQRYNEAVEGSRKEDIAIARANLNQAQANLGLSRVDLGYTVLRAPAAGVITVREAELGEVVSAGTPVVTLADLDHIWLRAYIAETDLGRIHWGQDATVTTDSYPGKQYHGRISFISSSAEFTPKSVQTYKERVTLVYRIKIDIDNANHELKPGMPADAHIELDTQNQGANSSVTPGK
jgi:membrane fusion protein YbhG